MRRLMMQRINGWTGDTAGASIEVIELLLLLVLSMYLYL
jgi:cobalamin synthase